MNRCYPLVLFLFFIFSSCGSYFNQPVVSQKARTGETSSFSNRLKNLPAPKEPVVVGVYNFKDQTGQYKNIENGSSFSTAVTQGGTSVLVKALEDSKWFTPIERENLSNLLNERNIIRSTRQEYRSSNNPDETKLPPLLYAGVLLEGGVVSYDTNIITGGLGARYFGVGGSTQYRQDRITVYLRAISTSSGKILKTVYISKTILSQAIDASLFKYVNFQRLLEVETGYTKNEPVQLAVKEAIEKAVEALIIEGLQDRLWQTQEEQAGKDLVNNYLNEKEEEEMTKLYNRQFYKQEYNNSLGASFGTTILRGDYTKKDPGFIARGSYLRKLNPYLGLSLSGSIFQLNGGENFSGNYAESALNLEVSLLPYDKLQPVIYGGPGVTAKLEGFSEIFNPEETYFKLQYGVALKYNISERMGIKLFGEQNIPFTDNLENVVNGKYNDFYFNFGIGLDFYFGKKRDEIQRVEDRMDQGNVQPGEQVN